MITINLMGGTGNQLFQWAFGRALESKGNKVQFSPRYITNCLARCYMLEPLGLNLKLNYPVPGSQRIDENGLEYKPEMLNREGDLEFHGYWQCERYFKHIETNLRNEIKLGLNASQYAIEMANRIQSSDVSAFIHIRRSDNLARRAVIFHGILGQDYYNNALDIIRSHHGVRIFVFSDDTEWIKANMKDPDMTIVETPWSGIVRSDNEIEARSGQGREHEDLWLMSLCRHGITANSTFSWWGAWLGDTDPTGRAIITPKKWFTEKAGVSSIDIVPSRWMRI